MSEPKKERRCVQCGKVVVYREFNHTKTKVINHKTVWFCNWDCFADWEKRTLIGKFDVLGETFIKGFEVRIFRDDGSTDVSDPKSNPLIEVILDIMTFSQHFAKGVTRENHTFYWNGKIPDVFKPLNREMIEAKIKEMIGNIQ